METYTIVSKLNGKVLDVQGGKAVAGTPIIMSAKQSPPSASQQWKLEYVAYGWYRVVSAMSDDLVLDIEGLLRPRAGLVLSSKNLYEFCQLFKIFGEHIWYQEGGMVLSIEDANVNDGARIIICSPLYVFHEPDDNQRWKLDGKLSFQSRMHGKVMDVEDACTEPGVHVIMQPKDQPPSHNQLWEMIFVKKDWCNICSKMNENLVFNVKGGSSDPGTEICLRERENPPVENQLFKYRGPHIISACGNHVLEIEGASEENGARIVLSKNEDCSEENQEWDIGCGYDMKSHGFDS